MAHSFVGHNYGPGGGYMSVAQPLQMSQQDTSFQQQNSLGGFFEYDKQGRLIANLQDIHKYLTPFNYTIYQVLKYLALLGTLGCIAVSIMLFSSGLFDSQSNTLSFMTNTYLKTLHGEDSAFGWPVFQVRDSGLTESQLTTPIVGIASKFESQLIECMYSAKYAQAQCNNASVTDYYSCLYGNVTSRIMLATCKTYKTDAGAYSNCLVNKNTQLTINQQSVFVTNVFQADRSNINSFQICMQTAFWPVYEVPQDIDSTQFFGSYNWVLILLVGFWFFTSFALYTAWPNDYAETGTFGLTNQVKIENGHPVNWFMNRMGAWYVVFAFIWNALLVIVVFMMFFRQNLIWASLMYPTSIFTGMFTIFVSFLTLFYFGSELFQIMFAHTWYTQDDKDQAYADGEKDGMRSGFKTAGVVKDMMSNHRHKHAQNNRFQVVPPANAELGTFPTDIHNGTYTVTKGNLASVYTPVLMATWADAYLFDALIVAGFVGATNQVATDEITNIFWGILYYRVALTAVARLTYEGFIANPAEKHTNMLQKHSDVNEDTSVFGVRVISLATHLTGIYFLVQSLFILLNTDAVYKEYTLLTLFVVFALIIPEALRLGMHLFINFWPGNWEFYILLVHQFIWTWDVIVRMSFVLALYYPLDQNQPGTKWYQYDRFQNLTSALAVLAA